MNLASPSLHESGSPFAAPLTPALVAALALLVGAPVAAAAAVPGVRPADRPPAFRIYDVDRRERTMRRLLGRLEGTPALSGAQARSALGELDRIKRQEEGLKARNGGRLTVPTIRVVDAKLNALSRRIGLREPAY